MYFFKCTPNVCQMYPRCTPHTHPFHSRPIAQYSLCVIFMLKIRTPFWCYFPPGTTTHYPKSETGDVPFMAESVHGERPGRLCEARQGRGRGAMEGGWPHLSRPTGDARYGARRRRYAAAIRARKHDARSEAEQSCSQGSAGSQTRTCHWSGAARGCPRRRTCEAALRRLPFQGSSLATAPSAVFLHGANRIHGQRHLPAVRRQRCRRQTRGKQDVRLRDEFPGTNQ